MSSPVISDTSVSVSFQIKGEATENVRPSSNHVLTVCLQRTDSFFLCAFALEHVMCVAAHRTLHQQVRYTSFLSTCNGFTYLNTKRAADE